MTPRTNAIRDGINCDSLADNMSTWYDHACQLELELQAANDMLARIHEICDGAGIPKTDGDIPTLEIQFCEGHRVKLMAERLAAASNNVLGDTPAKE